MKVSTKGRYGLRAVVFLASRYSKSRVSIKKISEVENISQKYLEQIFAILKKNDIVRSVQGSSGGYYLNINPTKLTVYDILYALEDRLDIIDESEIKKYKSEDIEYILIKNVWNKLNNTIAMCTQNISIADLVNDYNKINSKMFYI